MEKITRKFLKLAEVIAIVGKSRSGIYQGVKDGTFPSPIKTGACSVAWTESSIAEWQESCINGQYERKT